MRRRITKQDSATVSSSIRAEFGYVQTHACLRERPLTLVDDADP